MRYGHMVHRYQPALESAPRKFSLTKRATTATLDFRRLISSLRGPRVVLLLIALPFLFAVFRSGKRQNLQPTESAQVPEGFEKYSYEAIRKENGSNIEEENAREKIDLEGYLKTLVERRETEADGQKGVSLIAACKDRRQSLSLALPAWEEVDEVKEIVLVDWGSEDSALSGIPLLDSLLQDGKMTLIRVKNVDWVLARAYNLAARFAVGEVLMKVDCDTVVDKGFLTKHHVEKGMFYTVNWGHERTENEKALRGVWMARKDDFWAVGGYDERIMGYGYEDVDLYSRWMDKGLRSEQLDLDMIRHTIAGNLLWAEGVENAKKVSFRMNEAVLRNAEPWKHIFDSGQSMQYEFSYSPKTHDLHAIVTKHAPDLLREMSDEEQSELRVDVLQRALHDEYDIPWDILPSLRLLDLEYLAEYLDSNVGVHVLVVSLEGVDTVSNVFNLVSALQLSMKEARPVIAVWKGPGHARVNQTDGAVVEQLFDLEATNAMLKQAFELKAAENNTVSESIRLIAAKEWPCVEELPACAEKYDKAYAAFSELKTLTSRVYDDDDDESVPLSIRKHALFRLSTMTMMGNEESRGLAYKALVVSPMVRQEQKKFAETPKVGIITEGGEEFVAKLANDTRIQHGAVLESAEEGQVPIVGPTHVALRRELSTTPIGKAEDFCDGNACTIEEVARDLANVFAICSASAVFPDSEPITKDTWLSRRDITGMMVADLRVLHWKH